MSQSSIPRQGNHMYNAVGDMMVNDIIPVLQNAVIKKMHPYSEVALEKGDATKLSDAAKKFIDSEGIIVGNDFSDEERGRISEFNDRIKRLKSASSQFSELRSNDDFGVSHDPIQGKNPPSEFMKTIQKGDINSASYSVYREKMIAAVKDMLSPNTVARGQAELNTLASKEGLKSIRDEGVYAQKETDNSKKKQEEFKKWVKDIDAALKNMDESLRSAIKYANFAGRTPGATPPVQSAEPSPRARLGEGPK